MFWVGVITAGMTAFYVFRAYFLAFFGEYRGHHHPHESPFVMTLPLIVLAVLSLGGGFLNVPKWLAPTMSSVERENEMAMIISASFGIAGILLAWFLYVLRPKLAESLKTSAGSLHTLIENKYYVDEIYSAVIVKPAQVISRIILWKGIDEGLIDGSVDGSGRLVRSIGGLLRQLQSGSIRNYATWVMAGSLLVIFILGLAGGAR
jgi:NADH-quinone oxidoreductase subunit L